MDVDNGRDLQEMGLTLLTFQPVEDPFLGCTVHDGRPPDKSHCCRTWVRFLKHYLIGIYDSLSLLKLSAPSNVIVASCVQESLVSIFSHHDWLISFRYSMLIAIFFFFFYRRCFKMLSTITQLTLTSRAVLLLPRRLTVFVMYHQLNNVVYLFCSPVNSG